nr:nuclear transport factor 2 family protein [Pseudomonas sp.]
MPVSMQANNDMQLACTGLVYELYHALDEHEYGDLNRLFTQDAHFVRLGKSIAGSTAIVDAFRQRPADMATRHVITNPIVRATGPDTAEGVFYMLVVRRHGVAHETPRPLMVSGPWRLSVVSVQFQNTTEGWCIARQQTDSQFEFPETNIPDTSEAL